MKRSSSSSFPQTPNNGNEQPPKRQKDTNSKHYDADLEISVEQCKQYLVQFPFIYKNITVNGIIHPLLFTQYIYKVYHGLRLLRPDVLVPLSSIDSMVVGCRILNHLIQQFPCMFVLK